MLFVAIRHLFEASAIDQAKGLLRSQLETVLAIRYIVFGALPRFRFKPKSDSRARETRARFFYVAAERSGLYHRQALLDGRWGRQAFTSGGRKGLKREIRENLARLDKHFPAQQAAMGPLRCFHPSNPRYFDSMQWFSFGFRSGSVRSIRALSKRLGCLWEYEVLYGAFSGLTHPRGIAHDVVTDADTESLIVFHPYKPDGFELFCFWACHWQMEGLLATIDALHPASRDDAVKTYTKVKARLVKIKAELPDGFF